jgi:hypothetical protein
MKGKVMFDWHFREVEDNYYNMSLKSEDIKSRSVNFIFERSYRAVRKKLIKENPEYAKLPRNKILDKIDVMPIPKQYWKLLLNSLHDAVCTAKRELKADGVLISYMNVKDGTIVKQPKSWVIDLEVEGGHVRANIIGVKKENARIKTK